MIMLKKPLRQLTGTWVMVGHAGNQAIIHMIVHYGVHIHKKMMMMMMMKKPTHQLTGESVTVGQSRAIIHLNAHYEDAKQPVLVSHISYVACVILESDIVPMLQCVQV
jgi:ribosome-associated toxin RatA of RatAB toxin-antitoxin module